jgi:hypothetical protein
MVETMAVEAGGAAIIRKVYEVDPMICPKGGRR